MLSHPLIKKIGCFFAPPCCFFPFSFSSSIFIKFSGGEITKKKICKITRANNENGIMFVTTDESIARKWLMCKHLCPDQSYQFITSKLPAYTSLNRANHELKLHTKFQNFWCSATNTISKNINKRVTRNPISQSLFMFRM